MNGSELYFLFLKSTGVCYTWFLLLLLILRYFKSAELRKETANMLTAANFTAGLVLVLTSLHHFKNLYERWYGDNTSVELVSENPVGPYTTVWIIVSLIYLIVGLLLLFGRLRRSVLISAFVVLLLNWSIITEWIIRQYRDYLPSAWMFSTEDYWHQIIRMIFIFLFSVFISYVFLYLLKKLPYDSVWLKTGKQEKDVQ